MPTSQAFSATRPINPPGVEPVLSEDQVWKGLQIKARAPQEFVKMITSCRVIKDEGNKVTREVEFQNSGKTITEQIEAYPNSSVYFEMSTGGRVLNLVSYGPSNELLLTYSFSNGIPGVSPESNLSAHELNERIGAGVQASIDVLRQMAKDGRI